MFYFLSDSKENGGRLYDSQNGTGEGKNNPHGALPLSAGTCALALYHLRTPSQQNLSPRKKRQSLGRADFYLDGTAVRRAFKRIGKREKPDTWRGRKKGEMRERPLRKVWFSFVGEGSET